jgi:hypothetical protein
MPLATACRVPGHVVQQSCLLLPIQALGVVCKQVVADHCLSLAGQALADGPQVGHVALQALRKDYARLLPGLQLL